MRRLFPLLRCQTAAASASASLLLCVYRTRDPPPSPRLRLTCPYPPPFCLFCAVPCAIGALKCKEPLAESKQASNENPGLPTATWMLLTTWHHGRVLNATKKWIWTTGYAQWLWLPQIGTDTAEPGLFCLRLLPSSAEAHVDPGNAAAFLAPTSLLPVCG
ncbi:hypothetical protein IWZ03DRAFT_217140 [Phyllosticta citriasiana]|uniref:Secreted protein n=1 Tax=Phyllosticta citriasiana TaxID=595635 RepID=A0ABR1KGI1_9PEZI